MTCAAGRSRSEERRSSAWAVAGRWTVR